MRPLGRPSNVAGDLQGEAVVDDPHEDRSQRVWVREQTERSRPPHVRQNDEQREAREEPHAGRDHAQETVAQHVCSERPAVGAALGYATRRARTGPVAGPLMWDFTSVVEIPSVRGR